MTGYKEEQIGKIAYIGNGVSSMAGLSLGYTSKNGLGIEADITPAFATMRIRLAIGDKNDDRGLLSFLHNRKEQNKWRSRDQTLARLAPR